MRAAGLPRPPRRKAGPFAASRAAAVASTQDLADADRVAEHAEARERLERPLDRVLRQPAGGGDVAAEPAQELLVVERRRRPGQALVDDEAHRVRADVDDRHRPADLEAPVRLAAASDPASGACPRFGERLWGSSS